MTPPSVTVKLFLSILAIYLGRVLLPSPKIAIYLSRTYKKLHYKGELYLFSVYKILRYKQISFYFYIGIAISCDFYVDFTYNIK